MKRTLKIILVVTISILAFYACIKEEYGSLKNIDKTVHILGSELHIPVGSTDTIRYSDIFGDSINSGYFTHYDTLAFDSATNEMVSTVLRLMYLSPETEVAVFAKFWNTCPRYAKATVYALDENDNRLDYGPLEYTIKQADAGSTAISENWITLNDRDKKLVDMKKLEVLINISENDTINSVPIALDNFLKGEVKLRIKNGITTNLDSLLNTLNEGF